MIAWSNARPLRPKSASSQMLKVRQRASALLNTPASSFQRRPTDLAHLLDGLLAELEVGAPDGSIPGTPLGHFGCCTALAGGSRVDTEAAQRHPRLT